ncbi:MAG: trypsin-like peptidase domain-containing protein [Patescibacteria group bacterium]
MNTRLFVLLLVVACVGGLVGSTVGLMTAPSLREPFLGLIRQPMTSPTGITVQPPVMVKDRGIAEDEQTIGVVEKAAPAVVSIVMTKEFTREDFLGLPEDEMFAPFMDIPFDGPMRIGGGSGFFVSSDGLIVTNRHVVGDEEASYTVVTRDGTELPATVLARDPVLDLAVLDVEGTGYPFLTFAEPGTLKTGQTVVAIGNALDEFRNTVTKGIISGLNRRLTANALDESVVLEEAIQTDAAINPGNSGGPLIDLYGRVVGVNTAMSYAGQLIGFALPGSLAARDVLQVQQVGRITRPFLGIRYVPITEDLAVVDNLPVTTGILVTRGAGPDDVAIVPGSPAERAGLSEGDIITEVDDVAITEERSLSSIIGHYLPGETVTLRVIRDGAILDSTVTLDEFKPSM